MEANGWLLTSLCDWQQLIEERSQRCRIKAAGDEMIQIAFRT